jgi:DNA mismatch repair protein MutS
MPISMADKPKTKSVPSDTPLMTQYHAVKAQHRDAVLFFRMGDFYEMFYDDARIASQILGLALTSRGHGKAGDVPLAGFPHHALDTYLAKMIRAGLRVAICDQVEDPKLVKTVVKREVTQVVTPGTVTDENLLESRRNNFLSSVCIRDRICGMASADVSTGEFLVTEFPVDDLADEVQSTGPSEILVAEDQAESVRERLARNGKTVLITKREPWLFQRNAAYELLTRHFGTASLKGFGCEDLDAGLSAACAGTRAASSWCSMPRPGGTWSLQPPCPARTGKAPCFPSSTRPGRPWAAAPWPPGSTGPSAAWRPSGSGWTRWRNWWATAPCGGPWQNP